VQSARTGGNLAARLFKRELGGFFVVYMRYDATCSHCGAIEIDKPMTAPFPRKHNCGGVLARVYHPIPVHYAAPGFYSTDVDHLKKQIGPERFASFEREKAAAEKRAVTGTQTAYERRLDALSGNTRE